ncbi:hypothetical protein TCAL_05363, partial [Tigriopus californicus]
GLKPAREFSALIEVSQKEIRRWVQDTMGSGSSKTGKDSASFEAKNEDEYRPVKNWEGEIVGWVERTESDKLRRKVLKEAPPSIRNSSHYKNRHSDYDSDDYDDEEDLELDSHSSSAGSYRSDKSSLNRSQGSLRTSDESKADLRSRGSSRNSDDSEDSPLISRKGSKFTLSRKNSKFSSVSKQSNYRRDSRSPSTSRSPSIYRSPSIARSTSRNSSRRVGRALGWDDRSRKSSISRSNSKSRSMSIRYNEKKQKPLRPRYKPIKNYPKPRPTLKPAREFSVLIEAAALFKACRVIGTDEDAIIRILGRHSSKQRQEIRKTFREVHKKDLKTVLLDELSGDFEALCIALITEDLLLDKDIRHLALIGMMARTSANGLHLLKKKYKAQFEEDLIKKIEKETKGSVEKVLIATFSGKKDPTKEIDPKNAQRDAEDLIDSYEDEGASIFTMILTNLIEQRNANQMREICEAFRQLFGQELSQTTRDLLGPDIAPAYCAFCEY